MLIYLQASVLRFHAPISDFYERPAGRINQRDDKIFTGTFECEAT